MQWRIAHPHEVIRARLQFDRGGALYSGLVDATRKTVRADGLAGLWLGFRLNIVRTIPQCIITFTAYETAAKAHRGRRGGASDRVSSQPLAVNSGAHGLLAGWRRRTQARRGSRRAATERLSPAVGERGGPHAHQDREQMMLCVCCRVWYPLYRVREP